MLHNSSSAIILLMTISMADRIKEPSRKDEKIFQEVRTASKSTIRWGRMNFNIGWMRPYTLERITDVSLNCKNDNEVPARTAALILLNGLFSITFLYFLLWRWLYHHVPSEVIVSIVTEGKKKEASLIQDYWMCIILATAMRDSKMNMKKEEADRILLEQRTAKPGQ